MPPFIIQPDEPKGYFNLEPEVRGSLLARLKAAGCSKWFCGHYHNNGGGFDEDLEVKHRVRGVSLDLDLQCQTYSVFVACLG